jgi:DNA repair exonuclease SbcCD nuclease subunit
MKLYHVADIHLGRRRLEGRLPDADLAVAFRWIAEEAVRDRAEVFLLAGDLFDRPQVDPPHLRQAQEVLRLLRDAGIPVVAIEGNHDRAFVHTETPTWVRFLSDEGLLMLLRPIFHAGGVDLPAWDETRRAGAWVEIGGVRFVGAGYLGAATPHKSRQIVEQLEPGRAQVLLLHAGPEYFVGEGGGFGREDLDLIRSRVTYLALGHIHKPMLHAGWACNPGSPENCDLREAGYSLGKDGQPVGRGYAVVDLDPAQPAAPPRVEIRSNPRRPHLRVDLDCTPFGNKTKHGEQALVAAAVKQIRALHPTPDAVVEVVLGGSLNLDRIALDPEVAAQAIGPEAGVFAVNLDATRLNAGDGAAGGALGGASGGILPRAELERLAIAELVGAQPLWGLDAERPAFAELFYELKESVRTGQSPEAMAERVLASPLVEQVRRASVPQAGPSADPTAVEVGASEPGRVEPDPGKETVA